MSRHAAVPEYPEELVQPLALKHVKEWISYDKGVIEVCNPVTGQPLSERPAYVGSQLGEAYEFWACRNNVEIFAGIEGASSKDFGFDPDVVNVYGATILDDGDAPAAAIRPDLFGDDGTGHKPGINTLAEGNGTPLSRLATELLFKRLEFEVADWHYREQGSRRAKVAARTSMAIGLTAMYCVGRWADAQHLTTGVRAALNESPGLNSRITTTLYMKLQERQMFLPETLAALGAPGVKMHPDELKANTAFLSKYRLASEFIQTGRLTEDLFQRLLAISSLNQK